jgi:serine phosphatase RsbU (regulator of sigma subunit)
MESASLSARFGAACSGFMKNRRGNALGRSLKESAREIATMLYGEVRPSGHFRFVNFGHPPPLVFSAQGRKFLEVDKGPLI